ncbi:MAG: UvrD-helicase domain-containing protein [Dokdonella sp.]
MNDVAALRAAPAALDWRTLPLDARLLIEASAGTGKTHNIGLVYLRLLLERKLGVEQILVTTFTDAAAQELRERLRRRLVEAERCLQKTISDAGESATAVRQIPACDFESDFNLDPESLAAYLAKHHAEPAGAKRALRLIQRARADLDHAPISTIHALCQRIQSDFPLQSHASFAGDTLVDESELMRECIEDFWRRRYLVGAIDDGEGEAVADAGPEALLRDVAALASSASGAIEADGMVALQQQIAVLSNSATVEALDAMASDKALFARGKSKLANRLRTIACVLRADGDLCAALLGEPGKVFETSAIEEQQAPGAHEPLCDHPLIRHLQQLRTLLDLRKTFARGAVLAAAAAECREQVPLRARQRNVLTFSMLIDDVYERLCGAGAGSALADCLYAAFPAALIDEFQDTDQRQFAIFDRIYRDADGASRGTLIMIGDPKQAIYGFRGGDIAAYLRARAQTAMRLSLAVNHRSSRALVGAVNALYGDEGGGFGESGIHYRAVAPAGILDEKPYVIDGEPVAAPLILHAFRGNALDHKGNRISALTKLDALALDDCADRIVAQLNDPSQTIDGKRVRPGDIAVLLSTNAQIAALRKRLLAREVPCVGSGRGNVFHGEVARDLELVLRAVLDAGNDHAIRGALSTRLLGAEFADFIAWQENVDAFERELERFESWRERVRTRGVLALIDEILALRASALLSASEGERTLTDLRHLGELLAEQESSRQGLEGLLAWFGAMRRAGGEGDPDAAEARQLRIESDAQRVQLLTIHASKGLEFPIVYLPMIWRISDRGGPRAPKVLRFHDAAGDPRIDLGSAYFAEHTGRHFEEDLQERQRLLYVALTRAVHAVHVYWVDRDVALGSGTARYARAWRVAAIDLLLGDAMRRAGLSCKEESLPQLAAALGGIAVQEMPVIPGACFVPGVQGHAIRATQTPLPRLRAFQWLHSFSGLVRQAAGALESIATGDMLADVTTADVSVSDAASINDSGDDPRLLALYSLRGPRFGDALHALLERAAEGSLWPAQCALVERELVARAIHAKDETVGDAVERVACLVDRTRQSDLGDGLSLALLAPSARVCEFEFQFPVQHVRVAQLRELCAAHGCADAVPASLDAVVLNGMLTGFVDLVFEWKGRYHVLDYKSNWLGARLDDYRGSALDVAMAEHHYVLQALLYTVALHRYLRQRLPDYAPSIHLGDSWYLFVRAIGLAPGIGVWRRAWPHALIEALDDAFAGTDRSGA